MINFQLYGQGGAKVFFLRPVDKAEGSLGVYLDKLGFEGKKGEMVYLPSPEGAGQVALGLGEKDLTLEDVREIFFDLGKLVREKKEEVVELTMPDLGLCHRKTLMAVYEGLRQGDYCFSKKTDKKDDEVRLVVNYTPAGGKEDKLRDGLARIRDMMDGVFFARDLVNERANVIYPESLARLAKEKLESVGVKVTVYEEEAIRDLGMEAYLAVARGAANRPRLIVMELANSDGPKTALVGKGLTYDSGGYCVKSPAGMATMHSDMGGAGSVIGTMYALGKSKAKCNVVGVVAACENMISGTAYKTGDIIGSMKGLTIEVVNTDAEGRLTLADAVHYASTNLGADRVIDLATLTGAVLSALGEEYTGAVTNAPDFYEEFQEAADLAGEKVWAFPYDDLFKKLNDSDVADIKNSAGREAGSVTAGLFVGAFVKEDLPWIHLDIAGTAYRSKARGYLPAMATGVHVKTLYQLLNPLVSCD